MAKVCDHEEACGCYVEGYAAGYANGQRQAYDQVLELVGSFAHALNCVCDPCETLRQASRGPITPSMNPRSAFYRRGRKRRVSQRRAAKRVGLFDASREE